MKNKKILTVLSAVIIVIACLVAVIFNISNEKETESTSETQFFSESLSKLTEFETKGFFESKETQTSSLSQAFETTTQKSTLPKETSETQNTSEKETTQTSVSQSLSKDDEKEEIEDFFYTAEDVYELNYILNCCVENNETSVNIIYNGKRSDLIAKNIAGMVCAYYVKVSRIKDISKAYHIDIFRYAGEHIVRAFEKNDLSLLTSDELETLITAWQIAKSCFSSAKTSLEIEMNIHDWLCQNVNYVDCDETIPDENTIIRPLTAIGALLDGEANCQGYADAFYLLCSIVGFNVGKQCVKDHIFNVIELDGKNYIVDVTFDDDSTSKENGIFSYYMFNVGLDKADIYTFVNSYNRYTLSATTDEHYYYNIPADSSAHGYTKSFETIEAAAQSVFYEYVFNSQSSQHIMICDSEVSRDNLKDALEKVMKLSGKIYSCNIWDFKHSNCTYLYVNFD